MYSTFSKNISFGESSPSCANIYLNYLYFYLFLKLKDSFISFSLFINYFLLHNLCFYTSLFPPSFFRYFGNPSRLITLYHLLYLVSPILSHPSIFKEPDYFLLHFIILSFSTNFQALLPAFVPNFSFWASSHTRKLQVLQSTPNFHLIHLSSNLSISIHPHISAS